MSTHADFTIERADDIPLLLAQLEAMRVPQLLDLHFPTHGNWCGLSLGRVSAVWLAFILSEADHRLNQVQPWVLSRLHVLSACLNTAIHPLDCSDDRLAAILDALADAPSFDRFETDLSRSLLRAYDLSSPCVRLDTTTVSSHAPVSPTGLLQLGQSKDHRPDLPQLKIALATLDPLGIPLVTHTAPGNAADDPLYLPLIHSVRNTLRRQQLLFVGDSKMAALTTRASLQQEGDYYLCPLAGHHLLPEELDAYIAAVQSGEQAVTVLIPGKKAGDLPELEGFETLHEMSVPIEEIGVTWSERRLLLRSPSRATEERAELRKRLKEAEKALSALNERGHGKRRRREAEPVWAKVSAILRRHRVVGLIEVRCRDEVKERQIRAYGERPAQKVEEREWWVEARVDEAAVSQMERRLGWRVHATNAPKERLTTEAMVATYRGQYRIEREFGRLKGKPLSLRPMYLQKEERMEGLVRLLTIALRVLGVMEGVVREGLREKQESVAGVYAGQPQRKTAEPTSERMLWVFREIHLVRLPGQVSDPWRVTRLSPLQEQILRLLKLPSDIYSRLTQESLHPVPE